MDPISGFAKRSTFVYSVRVELNDLPLDNSASRTCASTLASPWIIYKAEFVECRDPHKKWAAIAARHITLASIQSTQNNLLRRHREQRLE